MNRIKKFCMLILTLAITIAFLSGVNANPQTIVKVEPYQNVFGLGQQFTANITITDVQDLFGLEVGLYWNSSVLKLLTTGIMLGVESHPNGVLYGNITKSETIGSGNYLLWGTSIGQQTPSFNGSGTIVTLTFNVTSIGSSELELYTELYNKASVGSIASPIENSAQNGYYSPIYISISPSNVATGGNCDISGYTIPREENINVTIQYRQQNAVTWLTLGNATTNEQGNYTLEWKPPNVGIYQVKALTTIQSVAVDSGIVNVSVTKSAFNFWPYVIVAGVGVAVIIIAILLLYQKRLKAKKT